MFQPVQGLLQAKPPTHLVPSTELTKKKVVSARHILGMSGARALTHNSEGRTLTHIPVPETNTLKQGEAWPREETAGNDYLGLRCSFLDMCRKIRPGSILFTSFDDNQFT